MRARITGIVAAVVASLGLATCGVASCLSVLSHEPPHPHWEVEVAEALSHPERARAQGIETKDYTVSLHPTDGACTLVVRDAAGKVLGDAKGGLCLVSITGREGDTWSFEATSYARDARIQLAFANPIFPKPLGRIALGGTVIAGVGAVLAVIFLVVGRRAPAARSSGGRRTVVHAAAEPGGGSVRVASPSSSSIAPANTDSLAGFVENSTAPFVFT